MRPKWQTQLYEATAFSLNCLIYHARLRIEMCKAYPSKAYTGDERIRTAAAWRAPLRSPEGQLNTNTPQQPMYRNQLFGTPCLCTRVCSATRLACPARRAP